MKTKSVLFMLAFLCGMLFSVQAQETLLIEEEISSDAWDAELLRLNPGLDEFGVPLNPNATNEVPYTSPTTTGGGGAYNNLNNTDLYFDKYRLVGAIEVLDPGLCPEGIVHTHSVTGLAVAFRLANGSGVFEMPELPTAGTIKVHIKNGNNGKDTNLGLEKYNEGTETWERIHLFLIRKRTELVNEFDEPLLDEVVTFDINSSEPIKLRLHNVKYDDGLATRFMNMYRIEVSDYAPNAVNQVASNYLKQSGRTLMVNEPTKLAVYNALGKLIFEQQVENQVTLPTYLNKGMYIVKSSLGIQKILLN